MDPRNTPGYRLHRALCNLTSIDVDQVNSADQERIHEAMALLEQVSLLTRPASAKEVNVQVES